MEGIIAIIIIVISLITSANKAKKVKQNAPGQSNAPQNVPQPVLQGDFWKQQAAQRVPAQGQQMQMNLPEGNSRECKHGSVGGSMPIKSHSEGTNEPRIRVQASLSGGTKEGSIHVQAPPAGQMEPVRPVMSAEEMRRAVVMAEILKRPQERMAEQSRRWSVR